MSKISGIYCILNKINNKIYIGQSNNVSKRLTNHKYRLKKGIHKNKHLQSSWNKYGEDAFEFNLIKACKLRYLDRFERVYIKSFDSENPDKGYNKDSGGNLYKVVSEETRRKISQTHSGKNHPMYGKFGKDHIRYGKHHSMDSILKMSKSNNSSGYFRVTKMNTSSCKQGYRYGYSYYENHKRKLISSIDLHKLEEKVKSKGLPWIKLSDME